LIVNGMDKIQVLPGDVISRIAAGEVVERPAAVAKELIDNSLDAGSRRITVEVADGGRGLIRVTDDGEGMSRADAPLAFQRHATSKLRSEQDLWAITTMGFRGEALPSIAAVSKIRMTTACRTEPVGTRLELVGGALKKKEEIAAASGTQVEVADLFFNTPARKKFLKATATEFSHISQMVQQAALAWPSVQFQLRHNGKEVLDYPGVASMRDRLLQIYGQRLLEQFVEVQAERPGLRVTGFIADPSQARAGRTPQDLFVNRRGIKNATVSHAVYDGYGSFLAKGHHPRYVLFLEVDPQRVDVNVHPTKREVRFADQDLVHQAVRSAVRERLGVGPASGLGAGQAEGPLEQWRTGAPAFPRESAASRPGGSPSTGSRPDESRLLDLKIGETVPSNRQILAESSPAYLLEGSGTVSPLGQIGRTFLIAQVGSELHVIDQHTAHERVLFERLWRAWTGRAMESQPLLISEPVDLPPHRALLLKRYLGDLEKLGLALEPFGSSSFIIRAVPALLGQFEYAALIHELADDLSEWTSASSLEEHVRPVLASLACHGAVRSGRAMELPEIKRLIEDWIAEGLPMTCPHGRRVALRLPEDELAKIFGRA
jgi:DNA mismatch repair protein MutL